ncbi:MAG: cell division protein ZapE [Pseudomonadales bacterium]|nr:cell division protein ZapE [Pseudomonadales bacterium]
MTPIKRYQRDLKQQLIFPDAAQAEAMGHLQALYLALEQERARVPNLFERLLGFLRPAPRVALRGLYIWGGVGRGKTYLMDLFYQCLPGERKMRMHFHRFMQMVHRELNQHKGIRNPLVRVAQKIAHKTDLICFDEFFVSDIGDAMILANLLESLFDAGVALVATSNIEPEQLYENGLQRQQFLPAIALLYRHTQVINLDGGFDYRLRSLEKADIYHYPLDAAADLNLTRCFQDLSAGLMTYEDRQLEILGRDIRTRCWAEGLVWFEFGEICDGPRSVADYIEIAQLFHTVLLANIPRLGPGSDDLARRFISLVDEFYDHDVKLVISAAVPLEHLYDGSELAFAFTRTRSRLLEMQSREYLERAHKP